MSKTVLISTTKEEKNKFKCLSVLLKYQQNSGTLTTFLSPVDKRFGNLAFKTSTISSIYFGKYYRVRATLSTLRFSPVQHVIDICLHYAYAICITLNELSLFCCQ